MIDIQLGELTDELYGKDFLLTWKHSLGALRSVLAAAAALRDLDRRGVSTRVFRGGLGLSIFRDKSTRTRHAFRAGCAMLGLDTEEVDESTSQVAHGETVRETAAMISFFTEVIGIRDDMFLGYGHRYMSEVARSIEESHGQGVLPRRTAVLNLQCDLDHPTQTLADLAHLASHFGGLENLRGKRLAMTWAYSPSYGKPLSVPQGVVALASRFGMEVVLAHPPGYELEEEPLEAARAFARQSGGSFQVVESMAEAFRGAHAVYPKSWGPRDVMLARTELLRSGRAGDLAELEAEALARNARHRDWECRDDLMGLTAGALYLHCLPADISGVSCPQGEVAAEVFERFRLDTYRQASYKPYIIAALILLTRLPDPGVALERLAREARPLHL
ncbi:MAG TPA: knotted carbamoyltransferase YgeW [Candidatus Nitrosotenuis sp.]|jgi:knotted carbamoyltransferase YgeW|nr:knotted carbamoyltransferase YgeW [Candidatus Nitrosotenuis sp.]